MLRSDLIVFNSPRIVNTESLRTPTVLSFKLTCVLKFAISSLLVLTVVCILDVLLFISLSADFSNSISLSFELTCTFKSVISFLLVFILVCIILIVDFTSVSIDCKLVMSLVLSDTTLVNVFTSFSSLTTLTVEDNCKFSTIASASSTL